MYIHCYTSNRMKTKTQKFLLVLAIIAFASNIYTGMNWSSRINGALIGYLYRIWIGDDNA